MSGVLIGWQISLTALYGMLLYVCGLAVVARVSSSTTRKHEARARLDFLRTSFGVRRCHEDICYSPIDPQAQMLFINLAIADSLQDLAFALDCELSPSRYASRLQLTGAGVHLARGASVSPAPFCTAQGVIIQLGAVASTFIVRNSRT